MKSNIDIHRLWEVYVLSKSVWKTGEFFGLSGQSVHERLTKAGYKLYGSKFSKEEDSAIEEHYKKSKDNRDLQLEKFAKKLKRPHHTNISRRARQLGLTQMSRRHTTEQRDDNSRRMLKNMQNGIFPRTYSNVVKGWYDSLDGSRYYLKSSWETKYAKYLDMLLKGKAIKSWEYEPDTFWFENIKRGVRSYTPDFKIEFKDGSIEYHEVKGWLDDKSKTKLKRMKKYHPEVKMVLIMKNELKSMGII